jgi:hypothetical protein
MSFSPFHQYLAPFQNCYSLLTSNETRSEENKSKIDATTEVFTSKALSEINKPGCILLTGNNRLERELDTDGKERSSLLRLEKDECLLTEGSEIIGRQVIRNEGV